MCVRLLTFSTSVAFLPMLLHDSRFLYSDALPISPTNLQVTDVEQTSARLLWEHVSTDSEQRAFFAVHYKPISFESYIIVRALNDKMLHHCVILLHQCVDLKAQFLVMIFC